MTVLNYVGLIFISHKEFQINVVSRLDELQAVSNLSKLVSEQS